MYPIFFQYKFISIGGYGVMLGIGFYLSFLLLEREFKLRDINPELAYKMLLFIIPGSIIGSKVFHILEHLDEFAINPFDMIFSGAGLSAYGGFVFSIVIVFILVKQSKERFLKVGDGTAPSMALGYCFGRFGCHVAGDGCYGLETTSIFATAYPNGIVPTTMTVFPTPLFEVFFSFIVLAIILRLRKKDLAEGKLFFLYLILNGLPRLLVEFIRLNPKIAFGMSQAQIVGILFIITGIAGWIYSDKKAANA